MSDQGWADAALGMDITSFGFIAFVAAVVVAFHLVPSRGWRTAVLSLANAAFIATYINKPQQIIPLLAFLLLGYLAIEAVRRRRSALAAAISIGAVLTIYVYLKRFSFLGNNYTLHFGYLIVGLSYILFRVLHLVIDARGGDIGEPIKPLAFLNYTCNFLTFVSGPIQQYQDFARDYPALSDGTKDRLTDEFVFRAFRRIIVGYGKVIIVSGIADTLFLRVSERILAPYPSPAGTHLVAAYAISAIAYTIYLYFNFSGYMDIVTGVGRLLGQDLPENFNKPFLARDFLEFWTRWHMTLSQWFKTYLFNPLMGMLIDRFPQPVMVPYLGVTAFFVTFFVMGVWHGTTPVFAIYGLLMGAGASINKLWQLMLIARIGRRQYREIGERQLYAYACRGLTCSFFAIGITCLWVNIDQLRRLWGSLGFAGLAGTALLIAVVCSFVMFLQDIVVRTARTWLAWPAIFAEHPVFGNVWSAAQIVVIVMVSTFFHKTPEFVYRAF